MSSGSRWFRRLLVMAVGASALLISATREPAWADRAFVFALPGPPESLDSAKATSERSIWVTWLLCDSLINISRDGQHLEPGLAESWTLSRDGLDVELRLRPGVVFHDGTTVDATAVKVSFERQFRPDHELYTATPRNTKEKVLSELIREIQAPHPLVVTMRLKSPGLQYLSQVEVVSPTALARLGAEFGRQPVCSGPFRFAEAGRDQLTLTANDRYWAGRPRLDRVVFRYIPDARAQADALVKGEVHFTPSVRDAALFERLRDSGSLRLITVPGLNTYYLGFATERPPFNQIALRRAVAHAINVPRLTLFLGRGAAQPAKGPLSPAMRYHDPGVGQPAYDLDAARALMGRVVFDPSRPVRLAYDSGVTMDAETATAIQHHVRQIGMAVELVGKPNSREMAATVQARDGDMFLYSWHIRAPYPERLLMPLFHSASPESTNLTRYRNPAVDRLLDEAIRATDSAVQQRLYSQVQQLITDDVPMVFLYHLMRMAAHSTRVKGLELTLGALPHDKLVRADVAP